MRRDYLSFAELNLDPDLDCFSKLTWFCRSDLNTSKSASNDCGITVRSIPSKKQGGGLPQGQRVALAGEFLCTTLRFIFCNCCSFVFTDQDFILVSVTSSAKVLCVDGDSLLQPVEGENVQLLISTTLTLQKLLFRNFKGIHLQCRSASAPLFYSLWHSCMETPNHMVPERDSGSWAAAVTAMFCVWSHDWFLASWHRTVFDAANLPFEEASLPPIREF